ncbi:adenosine receptor A1-like [Oculina patagonica]
MSSTNATTNQTTSNKQEFLIPSLLGWAISYAVVAVAVMVGNSLTIAAFSTNKKLATARTNYFLVSLGVADFMVGACSIPMYVAEMLFFYFQEDETSIQFHEIYLPIDAFMGFASIFALVAIALDRAYSVFRPHRHKSITKATYLMEIALVWFLAACVAGIRVLSNFTSKELLKSVFNYAMIVCIFTSLILIFLAYALIWHRVRNPVNQHHRNATKQEKKLAVTLSIITLVFVLTWVPFYIMNITIMFCQSCYVLQLIYFAKFLHYSNSFANFVIYALKIREFRKTVFKLLCGGRQKVSMSWPKERKTVLPNSEPISLQDIRIRRLTPHPIANGGIDLTTTNQSQ